MPEILGDESRVRRARIVAWLPLLALITLLACELTSDPAIGAAVGCSDSAVGTQTYGLTL
jgi:hypothetical protein